MEKLYQELVGGSIWQFKGQAPSAVSALDICLIGKYLILLVIIFVDLFTYINCSVYKMQLYTKIFSTSLGKVKTIWHVFGLRCFSHLGHSQQWVSRQTLQMMGDENRGELLTSASMFLQWLLLGFCGPYQKQIEGSDWSCTSSSAYLLK